MQETRYALGHFAEGTAFLSEIYYYTDTTSLSTVDALLDSIDKIWLARANVGPKNVRTIT
jgi:hypothetical protein